MFPRTAQGSWIDALTDEDRAFLKRFVLASGSLKDLAQAYGVTYPTIRLRLDRLVDKIKLLDRNKSAGEFERTLLTQYADGKLDVSTMKTLLAAHQRELKTREADDDSNDSKMDSDSDGAGPNAAGGARRSRGAGPA